MLHFHVRSSFHACHVSIDSGDVRDWVTVEGRTQGPEKPVTGPPLALGGPASMGHRLRGGLLHTDIFISYASSQ